MTAHLHYGTSSWSEKSWVGPFYPPGTKPADFLARYAEEFSAVEADNTYYAVPRRALVEGWERKTPDGFRLCAKFPRSIVHGGDGPRPDPERVLVPGLVRDDTTRFLEAMHLLGPKLGPLVLQFPYFNKSVFAHRDEWLERLDAFLAELPRGDGLRYAVEVRNKGWIDDVLLQFLRDREIALVLVELAYLPHPASLAERFDLVTTDFVYARLIGDRKKVDAATDTFDRIVLDKSKELERWAGLLRDLRERVPEIYVFANNHYAGHGPDTIRDLVGRLDEGAPG